MEIILYAPMYEEIKQGMNTLSYILTDAVLVLLGIYLFSKTMESFEHIAQFAFGLGVFSFFLGKYMTLNLFANEKPETLEELSEVSIYVLTMLESTLFTLVFMLMWVLLLGVIGSFLENEETPKNKEGKEENLIITNVISFEKCEEEIEKINGKITHLTHIKNEMSYSFIHDTLTMIHRINVSIKSYDKMRTGKKFQAEEKISEMIFIASEKLDDIIQIYDEYMMDEIHKQYKLIK